MAEFIRKTSYLDPAQKMSLGNANRPLGITYCFSKTKLFKHKLVHRPLHKTINIFPFKIASHLAESRLNRLKPNAKYSNTRTSLLQLQQLQSSNNSRKLQCQMQNFTVFVKQDFFTMGLKKLRRFQRN